MDVGLELRCSEAVIDPMIAKLLRDRIGFDTTARLRVDGFEARRGELERVVRSHRLVDPPDLRFWLRSDFLEKPASIILAADFFALPPLPICTTT